MRKSLFLLMLLPLLAYGQATPAPMPKFHAENNSVACSGCKLYTYTAGTTTPQSSYTTKAADVANANPVVLNANGDASVWLKDSLTYKLVLKDAAGVTIWTVDNIQGAANPFGYIDGSRYSTFEAAYAATAAGKVLILPPNTTYNMTAGLTADKNIDIRCTSRSTVINAPSGGIIFTGSGTVTNWSIDGCDWEGNGDGSQLLTTPSGGSWGGGQGDIRITNNLIANFGGGTSCGKFAIDFGVSTYWNHIENNYFTLNTGDLYIHDYSEISVVSNQFVDSNVTTLCPAGNPHIKTAGAAKVTIADNDFEKNAVGGAGAFLAPDLYITDGSSSEPGHLHLVHNRFGAEGDVTGRNKVQIHSGISTGVVFYFLDFDGNEFDCNGSPQVAILSDNSPSQSVFRSNKFSSCATAFNDNYLLASLSGDLAENKWIGNEIRQPGGSVPTSNTTWFTNGGRGFSVIDGGAKTSNPYLPVNEFPRDNETRELRNLFTFSEALGSWVLNTGVTATEGQTDPQGTTRATKLTSAGGTNLYAAAALGAPARSRLVVEMWCKAGTLSTMEWDFQQVTAPAPMINTPFFQLGTDWKKYRQVFAGLDTSKSFTLYLYPGTKISAAAGDIYCTQAQASYFASDYLPTLSSALSDTTIGNSHELSSRWGDNACVIRATINGAQMKQCSISELITLATGATTTDSSANLLPAAATIEGVVARVTTTITAACTSWAVGDSTTAARFTAVDSTLTANETQASTGTAWTTGIASATTGTHQGSAAKVRITCGTGNPGAGKVRVTVFYSQPVVPSN